MFLKISRHGDMKAVSYIVFLALWSSLSIKSLSKRLCFLLMVNEACWTHSMLRYVTVGACSSLSWVWPHDIFPLHGSISIYITVAPVLFLPPFLGETISQQTSWCSESHDLSSPSSVLFPEPHRCRSCGVDLCVGLGVTWSVALTPWPIEDFCDHMTVGTES